MMVLFPGADALDARSLPTPPTTLLVVDGSWIDARKLIQRSPLLAALPRVGFLPSQPSNYRIRREPAPHCLSTIEAVAWVLEALEDAPGRFTPMLASFERMVDTQIAFASDPHTRAPRRATRPSPLDRFRGLGDRLVLVAVDSHAPEAGADPFLEWAAIRVSTGERFDSRVRLPHPVSQHRPRSGPAPILDPVVTETPKDATSRWRGFAPEGTVLCTWGSHPIDLLRQIGVEPGEQVDLKPLVANALHTPLGGLEHLAERLGAILPTGQRRALRNLAALEAVTRTVLSEPWPPKEAILRSMDPPNPHQSRSGSILTT